MPPPRGASAATANASSNTPAASHPVRRTLSLDTGWRAAAFDTGAAAPAGIETAAFDDRTWRSVDVPHNWDAYEGFRQLRHGDRHGTAWYRRTFDVADPDASRRLFLFFEGVGSYATVWVNGQRVGMHAGGLTTFTLDITRAAHRGSNLLVVRADHPAGIRDLPWVCGGCELAYGFSEGTQPFGIFRPVHLVSTAPVRIEPFGVHVWNDADVNPATARIHLTIDVKNYGDQPQTMTVVSKVRAGRADVDDIADSATAGAEVLARSTAGTSTLVIPEVRTTLTLAPGAAVTVAQEPPAISRPLLWSPQAPNLYAVETELVTAATGNAAASPPTDVTLDALQTTFGIRTVHWPSAGEADGRLLVNGEPVFNNGICDYEHNLGASHAFTAEQIGARARELEAAGFNAFRDAHHPHNLRFQRYWESDGLLWWPQFGAHIWFDNDAFRSNFKTLLRDWVKERRNSPALVLWGLQNESVLPTAFAQECAAIIRELDPTASSQRKITTCNGGTGTDWDVPQNWSGTYSGNPQAYAEDLQRQRLVGEYGAWRSLGLHTEGGFEAKGALSEDRMTSLLEMKVRLAESVRGQVAGHFMWLFTTHSNPGRNVGEHGEQAYDGIRPLDHISPANNKGLFTIWGEPLDAYFMYRSNYAPVATAPMVYIASHTWPDRWTTPGRKNGIVVYSNCEEVELFNDLQGESLGRRTRGGPGTHFEWNDVPVRYNVLYAEGRVGGKVVACDWLQLHALPAAPRLAAAQHEQPDVTAPRVDRTYLYRVNCGGPDYIDTNGNRWEADHDLTPGEYEDMPGAAGVAGPGYRAAVGSGAAFGPGVGDAGTGPRPGAPENNATTVAVSDSAAEKNWGSISWAAAYPNLSPRFGSQRKTYDPIAGTRDPALFQTFRYGRDALRYVFAVPNGNYEVELYFVEPWYGDLALRPLPTVESSRHPVVEASPPPRALAARNADARFGEQFRVFDVAVNDTTVLHDLDLYAEAGRDRAVKKIIPVRVSAGRLELSFPRVAAGQAVISAIAIARLGSAPAGWRSIPQPGLVTNVAPANGTATLAHALDTGDAPYRDVPGSFTSVLPELLDADWIQTSAHAPTALSFTVNAPATVFVAVPSATRTPTPAGWEATDLTLRTNTAAETAYTLFRAAFAPGARVDIPDLRTDPSQTNAIVFVVRRRPPPAAQYIREVAVTAGNSGGQAWRASGSLTTGRDVYIDATARIAKLPDTLADSDLLSPTRSGATGIAFNVTSDAEIYVAVDSRISEQPSWLADWIDARQTITTTDRAASKFSLLRRRAKPGERVTLGANGRLPSGAPAPMYFALVRAVRPSLVLAASAAKLTGATLQATQPGASSGGAVLLPAGENHAITWTVNVGVGDRYGLDFRFTAPVATSAMPAELTLIDHDGHVLRTDKLEFPAVPVAGRWTFLRTRTGASINAGTYHFRLTLKGTGPLVFDTLEVQ